MMLRVQAFESLAGYMGINLCSGNIAMSQQHLHDAKVRTVVDEVRCEGMAQGVRRQMLGDARQFCIAPDQ